MATLSIGEQIPPFKLKDGNNEEVALDDLLGDPFILYFYPKDNTPGCTQEACDFRDLLDGFESMNLLVVGVSPDSSTSHQKFAEQHELSFPLLSDPEFKLAKACGAVKEGDGGKLSILRSTFLCDGDGIVQWVESPVKVEGHARRVVEAAENILS